MTTFLKFLIDTSVIMSFFGNKVDNTTWTWYNIFVNLMGNYIMTTETNYFNYNAAVDEAVRLDKATGAEHIVIDNGISYEVFRMPAVGDKVSYAFNGDYRPCGEIVKITPTWRITTSEGTKFFRKSEKTWKKGSKNGTFSLVKGHIDERNPSF